jgi:hypothetical protein
LSFLIREKPKKVTDVGEREGGPSGSSKQQS